MRLQRCHILTHIRPYCTWPVVIVRVLPPNGEASYMGVEKLIPSDALSTLETIWALRRNLLFSLIGEIFLILVEQILSVVIGDGCELPKVGTDNVKYEKTLKRREDIIWKCVL